MPFHPLNVTKACMPTVWKQDPHVLTVAYQGCWYSWYGKHYFCLKEEKFNKKWFYWTYYTCSRDYGSAVVADRWETHHFPPPSPDGENINAIHLWRSVYWNMSFDTEHFLLLQCTIWVECVWTLPEYYFSHACLYIFFKWRIKKKKTHKHWQCCLFFCEITALLSPCTGYS